MLNLKGTIQKRKKIKAPKAAFLALSKNLTIKSLKNKKVGKNYKKDKYFLFEEASFMVLVFGQDEARPLYLNKLAKRYCGPSCENLLAPARPNFKINPIWQGWRKRHAEALRALFTKKIPMRIINIPLHYQSRLSSRERRRSERYFKFIYQPLGSKTGPITEVIVFGLEVSEQLLLVNQVMKAMEGLREEREKTSVILESISDVFIAIDRKWNITYMNKRAEFMHGKPQSDSLGKKLWSEFPIYKKPEFANYVRGSMQQRKFLEFDYFYAFTNKWWHYRCHPTPEGLVLYASDITEKKEMELQKDAFIAHTSHELKTPITSLKLYAGTLLYKLKKSKDTSLTTYVEGIDERLNKLTGLINSLLEASRIQRGKISFNKTKFSIDKLVEEAVGNIRKIAKNHKLTVKNSSLKMIEADRGRIEQVFINLINNACSYSPSGSEVVVTVTAKDNNIVVAIKDSGIGLTEKDKENIFKSFYQVNDRERKKIPSGLGLGLSISKNIVEAHGGKIWVESIHGQGSTFFILLPVKDQRGYRGNNR